MTEQQWMARDDPMAMLQFVQSSDLPTERKLRCFALACGRRYCRYAHRYPGEPLIDDWCRRTLEMAERFHEGEVEFEELERILVDERKRHELAIPLEVGWDVNEAVRGRSTWWIEPYVQTARTKREEAKLDLTVLEHGYRERAFQAALLRDLFGPLPFRRVPLDPVLLTGVVVQFAQDAYDNRRLPEGTLDPARLAAVAAALQDAGCVSDEILSHLRRDDISHFRGCWSLDLILGR